MKKYYTVTVEENQGKQTASVNERGIFNFKTSEAFSFETESAAQEILKQVEKEIADNIFLSVSLGSYEIEE